jgi:3-phosphoglycerate kinase
MILDVGPQSTARIHAAIDDAATLVWNGPLGAFEMTRSTAAPWWRPSTPPSGPKPRS